MCCVRRARSIVSAMPTHDVRRASLLFYYFFTKKQHTAQILGSYSLYKCLKFRRHCRHKCATVLLNAFSECAMQPHHTHICEITFRKIKYYKQRWMRMRCAAALHHSPLIRVCCTHFSLLLFVRAFSASSSSNRVHCGARLQRTPNEQMTFRRARCALRHTHTHTYTK